MINLEENSIINNNLLLNSITAQSILLFVQSKINNNSLSPEKTAHLICGLENLFYVIRELNSDFTDYAKDNNIDILRNKHQELYFIEGRINNLIEFYIESKDESWKNEFISNKERILKSKFN